MRKLLLSLSLLVMTAMTAMAQYTVSITSDPVEDYVCGEQVYTNAEICEALGLADAAALQTLLNEGDNVYIELADGLSNVYTAGDHNQWWLNMDGVPTNYADAPSWFAGISFDLEEGADVSTGVVSVYVGQMPGVFKKIYEPSTLKAKLVLKNGDKQISFDVTLNVNPAVQSNIPAPATSFAALEVVKTYDWTVDFLVGKSYEGKTVSTTLDGIYEALGVSQADLDASIADVIVTRAIANKAGEGEEPVYEVSDVLGLPEALAGGAWFGRYSNYDEATDSETAITPNAPMGWGAGHNTIYTQEFKLAEGEFSFVTGQYPDKLAVGDNDIVELYICNGTKAAKVAVKINVTEPERVPFEEMTKAGEETVEVSSGINPDYTTKPFAVDMEAILEAIGVEEVDDFFTWAAEDALSNNYTANGGYWYNEEGYICAWGTDAAFFIEPASLAEGKFNIGQYPNHFAEITEPTTVKADIVLLGLDKYYVVKVQYTVNPATTPDTPVEYTKVGEEGIVMQIIPSTEDWAWGTTTALDMDYIESVIGTQDFKLYTDKASTDEDGNTTLDWSANYTCTPYPGFWYGDTTYENKEHQVVVDNAGWGQNSFGVTYAEGTLTWYQYPGQRQIGDEYMAHLYLVNEETGAYLDYLLVAKYVEEVGPEAETVGKMDIVHTVTAAEAADAVFSVALDTKEMFEILGLDAETIDAATVVAQKSSTMYYSTAFGESLGYNMSGYYVALESEALAIQATLNADGDKVAVEFDVMDVDFTVADEVTIPVRFGIEYDGKRYMYTVALTNKIAHKTERLPLIGGSGEGSEMAIEVLEADEDGNPLSAKYTITNGTWGNNASHMSLFKYAPLSAEQIEGYNGVIVVFDGEVPASEGTPTYDFIPVGFVCPAGWNSIKDTDKFVYAFTDDEKAKGIEDFSIFFNASGSLKDATVTIKGVYLVTDLEGDPTGIQPVAPAATVASAGIYTIAGAKVNALQHGVNIVKMADGSVRKVYVK